MKEQRGPTPEDLGRVVRWAIMLFFAYAIVKQAPQIGWGTKAPAPATQTADTSQPSKPDAQDCERGSLFSNFSMLAMPLHPVVVPSIAVSNLKDGSGEPTVCGQKVSLRYLYSTRGGDVIFSNMDKGEPTKDVIIGGGELLPGLERGLIGMKPDGERDVTMAPSLGFAAKTKVDTLRDHEKFKFTSTSDTLTARATLLSATPPVPSTSLKLRTIDQRIGGDSDPVQCGNTVSMVLSLWKLDGTLVYSNENKAPLTFRIGMSQMPYGIEQAVINMTVGGRRTVIIPPEWMEPLRKDSQPLLEGITLPEHEIMLAAIGLVEIPASPAPATEPPKQ